MNLLELIKNREEISISLEVKKLEFLIEMFGHRKGEGSFWFPQEKRKER